MKAENILVVDDEPGVRDALEDILRDEGFIVATAASGEDGLEALEVNRFDAVLLDVWLPGIDGLETLIQLRRKNVDSEVIMISGHGTVENAVKAIQLGANNFIEKPLSLDKTVIAVKNAEKETSTTIYNGICRVIATETPRWSKAHRFTPACVAASAINTSACTLTSWR